jgi:regulator of protease activity HflC (stomatin/prohibitin superfamily)
MSTFFDTHYFVSELKKCGLSEEQTETITRLHQETIKAAIEQIRLDDLATKRDLKELELQLTREIEKNRTEIERTKAELIRWVVGVGLLQSTLIIGILSKIAKLI